MKDPPDSAERNRKGEAVRKEKMKDPQYRAERNKKQLAATRKRLEDPEYSAEYKKKHVEATKNWQAKNREKTNEIARNFRARHKDRLAEEFKNKPQYTLRARLSARLEYALERHNAKKPYKGLVGEILGCTMDEFVKHIESQFTEGMSWEKRSDIHIDHVIPCSYFNLLDEQELNICWNYRNMQPLWAKDNLAKNDSVDSKELPRLEEISKVLGYSMEFTPDGCVHLP